MNACPNQFKHWHNVGYLSIKAFSLCVVNLEYDAFIIFHSDQISKPTSALYLALVYNPKNNGYFIINFIIWYQLFIKKNDLVNKQVVYCPENKQIWTKGYITVQKITKKSNSKTLFNRTLVMYFLIYNM